MAICKILFPMYFSIISPSNFKNESRADRPGLVQSNY